MYLRIKDGVLSANRNTGKEKEMANRIKREERHPARNYPKEIKKWGILWMFFNNLIKSEIITSQLTTF